MTLADLVDRILIHGADRKEDAVLVVDSAGSVFSVTDIVRQSYENGEGRYLIRITGQVR